MESGQTVYWEHCGMLHVPSYRRRWEEKLGWYQRHGIRERGDAGEPEATLIVTKDEANGSIDSARIARVIGEMFGS